MKKQYLLLSAVTLTILLSSCYTRIGDLTMISNRNIDSNTDYVLLKRDAIGKAKAQNNDALERAIDDLTKRSNGEYIMNAKIYVKNNGRKVKIEGDVWGVQSSNSETDVNVTSSVTKNIEFDTGDKVSFKILGKIQEGEIVGINSSGAVVEFVNALGQTKKKQISFDDLTQLNQPNK